MVDLNTLVPHDSAMHLVWAMYVNGRGEIAGFGSIPNGDVHTFLLIPRDENHSGVEGCDCDLVDAEAATRENPASVAQKQTAAPRTGLDFGRPGFALGPDIPGCLGCDWGVASTFPAPQLQMKGATAKKRPCCRRLTRPRMPFPSITPSFARSTVVGIVRHREGY